MILALNMFAPRAELTKRQKAWIGVGTALAVISLLAVAEMALAGAPPTTSPFAGIWTLLTDWTQGTLGRIITLLIVLAGVTAGVLTQSLGAFAVGLGAGMGLFFAPDIINVLFGATIAPMVDAITPVTHALVTTAMPLAQAITPIVGM